MTVMLLHCMHGDQGSGHLNADAGLTQRPNPASLGPETESTASCFRCTPNRGQSLAGQRPVAMAAAAAASMAMPSLPNGGMTDLFTNCVFLAGFWAWFVAQFLKVGDGLAD
jgi:hypothetical protein